MVWSNLIAGIVAGAAAVLAWSHVAAAQAGAVADPGLPALAPRAPSPEGMVEDPCPPGSVDHGWAALCRFRADNAAIARGPRPRVVFIGDSITANWLVGDPGLFARGVVDRGISGQTSPQILLRFYQDVVALRPLAVHIMAGTNDVAGNTGPNSPDQYRNNIMAMVTLARANHIRVVLASIPPAETFGWRPFIPAAGRIAELNLWLKAYAAEAGVAYADYHAVLAGPGGRIDDRYSADGVHPNRLGYQVMRPVADAAIGQALGAQAGDR